MQTGCIGCKFRENISFPMGKREVVGVGSVYIYTCFKESSPMIPGQNSLYFKSLHLPYIPKCLNSKKGVWKNLADYWKTRNSIPNTVLSHSYTCMAGVPLILLQSEFPVSQNMACRTSFVPVYKQFYNILWWWKDSTAIRKSYGMF